ncbi:GNAT family N-acetyltransferase [Clostridium intestinale]|uniref:GNAT family N-acetyltransferase n=1 Tax=Clostridium intestinale TaxID=36845 RepID=A0A7D7A0Z9_9CLOT|nr:GNAT family N-acetyltransferase [Clostridium intestinale]QLY78078.1 GNAT family N-acetyltransferase [Clostridium intestinale]
MKERKATYEEVKQLKLDNLLELPWDCLEEYEFLYLFEKNSYVCAVIRLSMDPHDNDVIWIDEFEILRTYRNQGIGKLIICSFLEKSDNVIKLMAKNRSVSEFWRKCGFQYDNPSWAEIPMIYFKQKI